MNFCWLMVSRLAGHSGGVCVLVCVCLQEEEEELASIIGTSS